MANTIIEKVSLNFTDLTGAKTGCTTLGSNKFWTGWVEDVGSGIFNFECRWGSTGTPGKDKGSKRGISETMARKTLASKVKSKEKKGYTKLETRNLAAEQAKAKAAGVTTPKAAPKTVKKTAPAPTRTFEPEVEHLLGVIYNETSKAVRSGLSAQAGATEDNPIGNLSDRQLDLGGEILDEIETLLVSHFGHETRGNKTETLPLGANGVPTAPVIDVTNRFMSNIPRAIDRAMRGRSNLHRLVVSSFERLEAQRKFLQLLRDAHLTKGIFAAAAAAGPASTSKAGIWYDGLGCDIEFCAPGTTDFKRVEDIFNTSQSKRNANWFRGGRSILRVAKVFKFVRQNTEAAYQKFAAEMAAKRGATGEIMAWHGTRTPNLLGIGKSGLLMPENLPRGVHVSGKAFGRGIYHAPAWNATNTDKVGTHRTDGTNGALKSMNYTSARGAYYGNTNTASGAFMFLQDVALGLGEVRSTACWDKRRPDKFPTHDFIYANAGKCSSLSHDELVTFDENAQMFRYLVEIEVR